MNDSIWATVLGVCKTLGVNEKYALYEISFQNAILYSRTIPIPGNSKKSKDEDNSPIFDESKDACNPKNFKNHQEEKEIKKENIFK